MGCDTGGTFTDLVTATGAVVKVLSSRVDPAGPVVEAVAHAGAVTDPAVQLAHGTTVATNALLERRGARVALVTNEGFADVIEIARQDRPSLYDPDARRPEPLVPPELRLEVPGRLDAHGRELEPVRVDGLRVPADADAVAVCLLHADLDAGHERRVADDLREAGWDVSCSHEVSPEFREYERTVTTVTNAYVRPICRGYLERLGRAVAGGGGELVVMTSAGGLVDAEHAAELPVHLLVSGPAGGVRAAAATAAACGFADAVTFDMGGTSTDVGLVFDGRPVLAPELVVGGLPMRTPTVDVHTIGAGGGSIAWLDPGGALRVGPVSAGADPGPVCYGLGGTRPTVTDADLVTGRIDASHPFPALGELDVDAARAAFEAHGIDPEGVVAVVEAAMVQAIRFVTVERGIDPRGLALVAFGGAGPLHACAIAEALDLDTVIVPPRAGVFSAVGLLTAPARRDAVRSWAGPTGDAGSASIDTALATLVDEVCHSLGVRPDGPGVTITTGVDCRYRGQSYELTVGSVGEFPAAHEQRNGYALADHEIEVIALRATAELAAPVTVADLPDVPRAGVVGPSTVTEPDCTVLVPAGWRARPGPGGALLVEPEQGSRW